MILSYALRLLCVMLVSAGLSLASLQFVLALLTRFILPPLETAAARKREIIFCVFQIGPALLAAFVSIVLCLPGYVHSEPNHKVESVSIACLAIAAAVGLWFAVAALRGFYIALGTVRFARVCRQSGQFFAVSDSFAVVSVRNFGLPVALVGFLHPFVVVSEEFIGVVGHLGPDALALALAHERAHAVRRDNWKLFCMAFIPSIDRFVSGCPPWKELWQAAADWAADDDAVQADPACSLLLAEVLVCAARCADGIGSHVVCAPLTSAKSGLATRIDRLVHPQCKSLPNRMLALCGLAAFVVVAGAVLAFSPWVYIISEWLLHLGTP